MPTRIAAPPASCAGPNASLEHDDAGERADQRLEVHERARELRGHARLRPGEQPEGERGAGQREREHGDDRAGGGRARAAAPSKTIANGSEATPPAASWTAVTAPAIAAGEQPAAGRR